MKKLILSLFFIAFLAPVHPAKALLLDSISGLKLSYGANYFDEPTEAPGTGNGFRDHGFGLGFGIQAYYELSIVKFFSVETGLGYRSSEIWREITINGVFEYEEKFSYGSVHIPLMAKLNVPGVGGSFNFGLGLDFDIPVSSEGKVDFIKGSEYASSGTKTDLSSSVNPTDTSSTYGVFSLGYTISVPGVLEVPFAIQGMRNLSIGDKWSDRVSVNQISGNGVRNYQIKTQDSWQLRLVLGAALKF